MSFNRQNFSHNYSTGKQFSNTKNGLQHSGNHRYEERIDGHEHSHYSSSDNTRVNSENDLQPSRNVLFQLPTIDPGRFCDALKIIIGNVRHPRYATVYERAKTFKTWPKKTVSVDKLTEAGFVYVQKDDIVECFHCGGVLRDWPEFADPWEQHAFAFPNCPHLRRCKGDSYITKVNAETTRCRNKRDNSGFVALDVIPSKSRKALNISEDAEDDCSSWNKVKNITLENFTVDNLGKALGGLVSETNEERNDGDSDDDSDEDESDDDEEASTKLDDLKEENMKLKDPFTCKICCDRIACIITLPCAHMVSCFQCISAVKSCAVCRTPIIGTVRALMAVTISNDNDQKS